jgi:transposase
VLFSTDNHPAHHVQEVVEHIYDSGAIVRYLPPYSPDLNPIEEVFAKVKHYLRQNDAVSVSFNASHFGRFAGFAVNIGTSGMLSFVAVPTI